MKELATLIQQFLSDEIANSPQLSEAAKESLSVAVECLEQAYELEHKPASKRLVEIYNKAHTSSSGPTASAGAAPVPDLTGLLQNLASSILPQMVPGAQQAATAAQQQSEPSAPPQEQPHVQMESQQQTTTNSPTRTIRKQATPAERLAAESFKNQGNDLMKQEQFKEAYECYSRAIEIDNNNAIYYSNRAAASSKLGDHQATLRDCQEAVQIDPSYSKAHGRMGLAFASLGDHEKARQSYVKAVELEPTNESYQNNLKFAEEKLAEMRSSSGNGSAQSNAQQPGNIMNMLGSVMNNPNFMSMAMQSLQDPRLQSMFGLGGGAAGAAAGGPGAQPANANANANSSAAPGGEQQQSANQQAPPAAPAAGIDLSGVAQQFMSSLQNNPDIVNGMRQMLGQTLLGGQQPPPPPQQNQNNQNPPPGYS